MNGEGINIYGFRDGENSAVSIRRVVLPREIEDAHNEFLYNLRRLGVSSDIQNKKIEQSNKKDYGRKNYYNEMNRDIPAWFDNKTGGYYIMQQGHEYGKETRREVEAARMLASLGYKVILQPEGDGKGGISFRVNKKGNNTYSEGTINKIYYEQFSTDKERAENVFNGITHGHKKGVSTALIYNMSSSPLRDSVIREALETYSNQDYNHTKTVKYVWILQRRGKNAVLQKWHIDGRKIR